MTSEPARSRRISRRGVLRLFGLTAAAGLAAACAPTAPAVPSAAPPTQAPNPPSGGTAAAQPTTVAAPAAVKPAAAGTQQPRTGGTLRYAVVGEPANLDAHQVGPLFYSTTYLAHDRLVQYDAKLQPQPMLAESWELSKDAKQIKLSLRKGVQFHSGREFTSDDVKWNILRVRDPKLGLNQLQIQSNWWQDIQTPDKYTVVLVSEQPRPTVFDSLDTFNMIDRDVAEKEDGRTRVGGTGPFQFVEWQQGNLLRYTKNKNYWWSGRPYLDEVVISFLKDQQTGSMQLEGGALEILEGPTYRDLARLRQDPGYRAVGNDLTGQYFNIICNCTKPPTNNKLFRQALNYAVDRKRFVDTVLVGAAQPRALPWPQHVPAYDASKANAYAFDLDKAKALIGQSGLANPEIDITFQAGQAYYEQLAQIFQADLAKIGVKATVRPMEFAAMRAAFADKNFTVGLFLGGFAHLESSTMFTTGNTWSYQNNTAGFASDQYKDLVTRVSVEPDAAKRKDLYGQLNTLLLDEAFILALASNTPYMLTRANVRGAGWLVDEAPSLSEAWLAA